MFKSVKYLRFDNRTKSYIYKLTDTDFESEVVVAQLFAAAILSEYKKRNYSHKEIVKNLFRYNLFYLDKNKSSFEEQLSYQNIYFNKYFKDVNFSKLYYQELKDMWDKHKAFI